MRDFNYRKTFLSTYEMYFVFVLIIEGGAPRYFTTGLDIFKESIFFCNYWFKFSKVSSRYFFSLLSAWVYFIFL